MAHPPSPNRACCVGRLSDDPRDLGERTATLFASGLSSVEVAARLQVSAKSARAWRLAWLAGGEAALASKGASGPASKLTAPQLDQLEQVLRAGPAAVGFTEDQRWTLARVADLIAGTVEGRIRMPGTRSTWFARRFQRRPPSSPALSRSTPVAQSPRIVKAAARDVPCSR